MDFVFIVMILITFGANFLILISIISKHGTEFIFDSMDKKSKRNRYARLLAKEIKKIYGSDSVITLIYKDFEIAISCKDKDTQND